MVASVTNYGRNGLADWLVQRVSAVILAFYTLFLLGYFVWTPELGYAEWKSLFDCTAMRIFSLLAILSLVAHAWIGLWTVSTDYIKPTVVRIVFQVVCALTLFVYMVWSVEILWGF
jgi:succinate dehydrogenase / fumarate reductase membrane anchor subunit